MSAPVTKEAWAELRRQSVAALPEQLAEAGLASVLLAYQQKPIQLLDSTAVQVLFIEKSRRIGMTWALASAAVLRAGRQKSAGGMDAMYISYSQEMTREFIDACAMWARAFNIAALEAEEVLFDDGDETGDHSIKAFRIGFGSGFEIIALSSAPRGLRGKQGLLIIDEAAFVDKLDELLKAGLAFLMWGGQVVVCSTHDGAENPFNVYVQDILAGRSNYAHLRVDLDQALKDGLYQRICLVRGQEWTPEGEAEWRDQLIDFYGDGADEELFCVPAQGSGTWLPSVLIEARMTEDAPILRLVLPPDYLHRPQLERSALIRPFMDELAAVLETLNLVEQHAFGFDFGRVADLSVGSLLAIEERLRRREVLGFELRGVPGDEQKAIVGDILAAAPRLVGAAFDATGMGWTVAEDMGRRFGLREKEGDPGLVWPVKFSVEWYRVNMPPLKTAFEDAAIGISADDEHLADLRLVKVVKGVPRIPDLRTGEKGKRRHGDYAVALALAHFASRLAWHEYAYQAALPGHLARGRFDLPDESDELVRRDPYRQPLGARLRGSI